MATYGFSGSSFDRWVGENSRHGGDNTLNKMQHQFWIAKQTILRRLGKKEDECVVASDAELDAKLELFLSIQETCTSLQKVIDQYQERLQTLAQEENNMGHFLRDHGKLDKTRAGKMMNAVGKAMLYSAQQRASLRIPLSRLHQEVETFCQRAIEDTSYTVNEMEKCRNDYRGALLWMKNVSQELDPDTYKQLDKFRRVQGHVRSSKAKFDRHKLACLQKIDLLAAARCNMFSHGLIVYQNNLAVFWQRTSKALQTVSEAYKGYQPYEFTVVKELTEPSLKLAQETNSSEPELEFFFENEFHDEIINNGKPPEKIEEDKSKEKSKKRSKIKEAQSDRPQPDNEPIDLLGIGQMNNDHSDDLLLELASLDFGTQDSELLQDLNSELFLMKSATTAPEVFEANFEEVFGAGKSESDVDWGNFLPSQLMSTRNFERKEDSLMLFDQCAPPPMTTPSLKQETKPRNNKPPNRKAKDKDMSSWYNLFADLDPLANPDALSNNKKEEDDRNC